jgi:hypothetical protein
VHISWGEILDRQTITWSDNSDLDERIWMTNDFMCSKNSVTFYFKFEADYLIRLYTLTC